MDRGGFNADCADAFQQGLLPSVRAFIDHLTSEFPKVVLT
jgi:hypothetical protein